MTRFRTYEMKLRQHDFVQLVALIFLYVVISDTPTKLSSFVVINLVNNIL